MSGQRKQFGKRGLTPEVGQRWGTDSAHSGQTSGAVAYAMPGYSSAGRGPAAFEDNDSFSVGTAIMHFVGMFFSFRGRIGRLGYWGIGTFNFIMVLAIWFANFGALSIDFSNREEAAQILSSVSLWSIWLTTLPFGISNISVQVRRFHDRDVSGMWMFAWFIPIVGGFIALFQGIANAFFAGTPGPNRFDTDASRAHVFD